MDDFEKYLGEQMKDEAFRKEWEALLPEHESHLMRIKERQNHHSTQEQTTDGTHDTEFYDGYEGEPEYVLERSDGASLHIWEGYLSDIMDPPCAAPWRGFTRDYEECVRTYDDDAAEPVALDAQEYLDDLRGYAGRSFEFAESEAARERICDFLQNAIAKHHSVHAALN